MLYPKTWRPESLVPQIRMDAATRRISFRTPQRVRTRPEVLPIWVLWLAFGAKRWETEQIAYQENNRDVQ
jgi:hypothetical protein